MREAPTAVDILLSLPFAGFVLACALGLMVWHVRSWRAQQAGSLDPQELGFRRRQFRRRMQTSTMLAVVAAALPIGVWILPHWPKVGVFFWGAVLFSLMWIGVLGLADMWATKHYYGKIRDDYRIEQARLEAELRRIRDVQAEVRRARDGSGNGKPSGTYPGKGPGVKGEGPETK
jgi:hypothetical protein